MGTRRKEPRVTYAGIMKELRAHRNPENVAGMARFGINPENAYGIKIPILRRLAKRIGKDHALALKLWSSGIHEARILASMIDDPSEVTEGQICRWVRDFDTWDICDQCCGNLLDKVDGARGRAILWTDDKREFVKRAGFATIAWMAFHDKEAEDEVFLAFLPTIESAAVDDRKYVKKAVNWALRQIGKRNRALNEAAIASAERIAMMDSSSAKWIASDALRELISPAVKRRLKG